MSYEDDFPPVETVPFDPFLGDVAIRVRCPSLNLGNVLGSNLATLYCGTRMRVPPNSFVFTKTKIRLAPLQALFTTDAAGRACNIVNTRKLSQTIALNKSRFNCNVFPTTAELLSKKSGPCGVKSAANLIQANLQNCRFGNRLYPSLPFLTKKICGKTARSAPNPFTFTRFRRLCIETEVDPKISKYLCRSTKYTIGNYSPVVAATSNASWSCRISEIKSIDDYVYQRLCKNNVFAVNLPINKGVKSNQGRNCKLVDVDSASIGTPVCHVAGLLMPAALTYTSANLGLCKLFPLNEGLAQRWRCGTLLLATLDLKAYGRVWGATLELPQYYQDFINKQFVRETGRMVGKIRY